MNKRLVIMGRNGSRVWIMDRDPTREEEQAALAGREVAVGPKWCEDMVSIFKVFEGAELIGFRKARK